MQNFGKIKNAFNELVSEGIAIKDINSQNLFKKYKSVNDFANANRKVFEREINGWKVKKIYP